MCCLATHINAVVLATAYERLHHVLRMEVTEFERDAQKMHEVFTVPGSKLVDVGLHKQANVDQVCLGRCYNSSNDITEHRARPGQLRRNRAVSTWAEGTAAHAPIVHVAPNCPERSEC
jgi:hypothetical protein